MLAGVRGAIENRLKAGELLFVVTHFADAFSLIQQSLETWGHEYDVVTRPIDNSWLTDRADSPVPYPVQLCLADLLNRDNLVSQPQRGGRRIGVMVLERHPLPASDQRIETFWRQVPWPVDLGYFCSFEDAVVGEFVGETTLKILDMFGMRQNELVTSKMVSRRVKLALARHAKGYSTNLPADSAAEWIRLNRRPRSPE